MCVRNDCSRRTTSSSKTEKDRRQRSSSRPRSSSRSRSVQRRKSTADSSVEDKHRRSRSASTRGRARSSTRSTKQEYDTPFDGKGKCHYHPDLQLARKKLTGGWKVIHNSCPKCTSSEKRFTRSHGERSKSPGRRGGGDYKSSSRSVCDNRSVSSRHSNASRSTRSSRSISPGNGKKKILPLSINNRKEERCPFDDKGYCHRHSNVRLAKKKKFTGGWKILLDRCHECVADERDSKSVSSRSSRRSRSKSVCSRSSRHSRSKSVCSRSSRHSRSKSVSSKCSRHDGRHHSHNLSDATIEVVMSIPNSTIHKKKSAKKMTFKDDTGKEGFYTGNDNDQYKPHARGKIVYKDKSVHSGRREETRVHGKFTEDSKRDNNHRSRNDAPKKEGSKVQVPEGEFEDSADFERQWENERRKAKNTIKVKQGKDRHGSMAEYVDDSSCVR